MKSEKKTLRADVLLLFILAPLFGVYDAALPHFFDAARDIWRSLPTLLMGIVLSQLAIAAAWSVFGPGFWWVRFAAMLGFVSALYLLAVVSGFDDQAPEGQLLRSFTGVLFVPVLLVASQSGMWGIKVLMGWRILDSRNANCGGVTRVQFNLVHLIAATTIVAASFGLVQLAMSILKNLDNSRWSVDSVRAFNDWALLLICMLISSAYGLVVVSALLWSTLKPGNPLVRILVVLGCFAGVILTLTSLFVAFLTGFSDSTVGQRILQNVVIPLVAIHAAFFAVIIGVFLLARLLGFRLYSARSNPAPPADADEAVPLQESASNDLVIDGSPP